MTANGGVKSEYPRERVPFVIVNNDGLQYVGLHADESDCWRIFLGWPTRGEVLHHMSLGYRCYSANVTWSKS